MLSRVTTELSLAFELFDGAFDFVGHAFGADVNAVVSFVRGVGGCGEDVEIIAIGVVVTEGIGQVGKVLGDAPEAVDEDAEMDGRSHWSDSEGKQGARGN